MFASYAYRGAELSLYLGLFNLLPCRARWLQNLLALRIPGAIYQEIARAGFLLLIVLITATSLGRWMGDWSAAGALWIVTTFAPTH